MGLRDIFKSRKTIIREVENNLKKEKENNKNQLLSKDSIFNQFTNFGNYDKDTTLYDWNIPFKILSFYEILNMYINNVYATRTIDFIPDEINRTWRKWFSIDDNNSMDTQDIIEREEKRINLKEKVRQAISYSRLYGGAIIVAFFKYDYDDFSIPITEDFLKNNEISSLEVISSMQLFPINNVNDDPTSRYFGDVEYFTSIGGNKYHISRCSVFYGKRVPNWYYITNSEMYSNIQSFSFSAGWQTQPYFNPYFGIPVFYEGWEDLNSIYIFSQLLGKMTSEASVWTYKIDGLQSLKFNELSTNNLLTKNLYDNLFDIDKKKSVLNSIYLDKNNDINQVNHDFSTLKYLWDMLIEKISSLTGIPKTRLIGVNMGGLGNNGEDETRKTYEIVSRYLSGRLDTYIKNIDDIMLKTLGYDVLSVYYNWNSLWEENKEQKINNEVSYLNTLNNLVTSGVLSPSQMVRQAQAEGFLSDVNIDEVDEQTSFLNSQNNEDIENIYNDITKEK